MTRFALVYAAAALALAGCGGSRGTGTASPANSPQATTSAYYSALARGDAATACAQVTPSFWDATVSEAKAQLTGAGAPPIPQGSCVHVMRYLFSLAPAGVRSQFGAVHLAVHDVRVHGATADAIATEGAGAINMRFVRSSGGHWLIDCCTQTQSDKLARAIYRVPSTGMEPTLKPGDLVVVDAAVLRTRAPSLGEIVALHPPTVAACPGQRVENASRRPCGVTASSKSADVVIKRVVGVPGDLIAMVRGHVVRNRVFEHEVYIRACGGSFCNFPSPILIPPGTYYVLGDNRGDSLDSRVYGPVPRAWLLGLVGR